MNPEITVLPLKKEKCAIKNCDKKPFGFKIYCPSHYNRYGGRIKRKCVICGTEMMLMASAVLNGQGKYCSRKCQSNHYQKRYEGNNNPNWKGGVMISSGRKLIYQKNHPRCQGQKRSHVFEYVLNAEKKIGRYLKKSEIVHHINENINDNSPENLEVMTQSQHAYIHSLIRKRNGVTGRFE